MKAEFLQELGLSPETAQQVCEASALTLGQAIAQAMQAQDEED